MPLLLRRIRARYPAWRRTCHNRSRRQKNRAWHARRGFGPGRSEPGLTSEQQEAAKTEILNRRSQRSQRVVGVLTSRFGSRKKIAHREWPWHLAAVAAQAERATGGRKDRNFEQEITEISKKRRGSHIEVQFPPRRLHTESGIVIGRRGSPGGTSNKRPQRQSF